MIGRKTLAAVVLVLIQELGLERAANLVGRLGRIPGNKSYRDTITAVNKALAQSLRATAKTPPFESDPRD